MEEPMKVFLEEFSKTFLEDPLSKTPMEIEEVVMHGKLYTHLSKGIHGALSKGI